MINSYLIMEEIMRKGLVALVCCIFVFGALWLGARETITRPPATSNHGIRVTDFRFSGDLTLHSRFSVIFRLTNKNDHSITFHPQYGYFVGARCNNQNRDFGHKGKGRKLGPGQSVSIKAVSTFSHPGTWVFWPAYNIGGSWGPYKWNAITVQIPE